jgi:glycosyltransferase involved in cell wall biosynthesis
LGAIERGLLDRRPDIQMLLLGAGGKRSREEFAAGCSNRCDRVIGPGRLPAPVIPEYLRARSDMSRRKIKILTIGHSYVVALNRAIVREVARHRDFEVTVAAPSFIHGDLHDLVLEPEPEGSPLRLVRLGARWSRCIHVFHYHTRPLRRLIRNNEFDLVHAWEEPYVYAGYQIARNLAEIRVPFSFWTAQNLQKNYPPPFRSFERATLARAQGWMACGRLVYDEMRKRGYPAERGRILAMAVDTAVFQPIDDSRRMALRRGLGLQPPVIGYSGRLTEDKGLDVLMKAMERIGGERPWNLLLLGGGPLEKTIHDWANARGWNGRVRIVLAKHQEVPSFLGAMDLLVAPSQTTSHWKEQFGRMLIEAFACGVPVIGSDSGEIPQVIGGVGRVVGEKDVEGWATAIVELLDRPDLRAELSRRGCSRCQDYTATTLAEKYRDYYCWLVEQPVA